MMDERKKKKIKGFLLMTPGLLLMIGWLILFLAGFDEKTVAPQPIGTKIIAYILVSTIIAAALIAFLKGFELLEESEEKCCEKTSALGSV